MLIRRCTVCGAYTLSLEHCSSPTVSAHPPPFKERDKRLKYRLPLRVGYVNVDCRKEGLSEGEEA